ncbi:four helix bundle protein [bacterium]|nr:four helix bundle protein [bacterium]
MEDTAKTVTEANARSENTRAIRTYRDLDVYKMAMQCTMKIFKLTKYFPDEEKYSLTNQIRRSSRSVCANLGEAWRKRRYKAAFICKLNDAEAECAETQIWAEIAMKCQYWDKEIFTELDTLCENILGKLIRIIDNPDPWLIVNKSNNS